MADLNENTVAKTLKPGTHQYMGQTGGKHQFAAKNKQGTSQVYSHFSKQEAEHRAKAHAKGAVTLREGKGLISGDGDADENWDGKNGIPAVIRKIKLAKKVHKAMNKKSLKEENMSNKATKIIELTVADNPQALGSAFAEAIAEKIHDAMDLKRVEIAGAFFGGIPIDVVQEEVEEVEVIEESPSSGLSSREKSSTVKAAEHGKDIGKPGKNFKKVAAKAAKEYGSEKAGERVAAAAMWKNKKRG